MEAQGFKHIRENAQEVVIQHPNGEFHKVTRGNFTTLEEYAKNTDTPFKLDKDGKREFYTEPFYLDYVNNFITVAKMAEHYGIKESHANTLINAGRMRVNKINFKF